MGKRLGIMGGTFNPIHNGHLAIAGMARRELQLDVVWFMPTGDSPHKRVDVPGWQRLQMVELALAGMEGFTVSDMEVRRAGRSYTCDTLRAIHACEPGVELVFILGGDMFLDIPSWREPGEIIALAALAAAPRPGEDVVRLEHMAHYLRATFGARVDVLRGMGPDISSTEIRGMVRAGRDISALVPPAVAKYISDNKLYTAREI